VGTQRDDQYRAADVFCFPSFYEAEAFPLVLLEALQFSLPVVATEWRGIPAIVEDGVNGLLVPTRAPDRIADSLERLLRDRPLRETMGARGRGIYLEKFTDDVFRTNMQAAFELARTLAGEAA
jgi:glycosyltransferase involved in cell wall biosynthesis